MILTVFSPKKAPSSEVAEFALGEFFSLSGIPPVPGHYLHDKDGAPCFDFSGAPFVSVSHSGEFVVAAISDKPVGVDIQLHTDIDFGSISKRFGMNATGKKDFFERFSAAEAKTKALRIPLPKSLSAPEARIFDFIPGATLAVFGEGRIFFEFCFLSAL